MPIHAESAIIINGRTGRVIYEKNSLKKQYPASVTKVATAIFAIDQKGQDLNVMLSASQDALGWVSATEKSRDNYARYPSYWMETGAAHIGIKRDEQLSFQDLLYGLMLASGDDAANVIAQYVGNGSIPAFMKELNLYLQKLGCRDTHFCNPHGLFHPDHMTTCSDIAKLCLYAMKNDLFRQIVKTVRYPRPQTNKQAPSTLLQLNRMLRPGNRWYYKYAIGIKTGYIAKAQHNVAVAAEKDGRFLIAVYMHCPDRGDLFHDARAVFEHLYQQKPIEKIVVPGGQAAFQREVDGAFSHLKACLKKPLVVRYVPQDEPEIRCQLLWDKVALPIRAGSKVGDLMLIVDNVCTEKVPLVAAYDLDKSFLCTLFDVLTSRWTIMTLLLCAALGLFIWGRRR